MSNTTHEIAEATTTNFVRFLMEDTAMSEASLLVEPSVSPRCAPGRLFVPLW